MIDPLAGLLGALVGLLIGPWLGVAVDRMVEREGFALDHRCATRLPREGDDGEPVIDHDSGFCGASLGGPSTLVPIRSWWATCPEGHGRSWRYPLVDLAAAVALGLAFGRFLDEPALLAVYAVFMAAVVVLAVIDLETKLLVNNGTFPLMAFMAFAILVVSGNQGDTVHLTQAFWGGLGFYATFLVMFKAYPPGLGFGDVKLAPSLGMALGWLADDGFGTFRLVTNAIIIAALGGAVVGIIGGWRRGNIRKAEFAFGPSLVAATILTIAVAPWMTEFAR